MFIITGNDVVTKQVRILDTLDMTENWVSYEFMKSGLNQGLKIRGLGNNDNIICAQPNLGLELSNKLINPVAKSLLLNNKNAILEALRPYGFADTLNDITVEQQGYAIHLNKINKFIRPNSNIEYNKVYIPISGDSKVSFEPKIKDMLEDLAKIPCFGYDGAVASLTHIVQLSENKFAILLNSTVAEITVSLLEANVKLVASNKEPAHKYYLAQLVSNIKETKGLSNFKHKYYIADINVYDLSSEAYFYEKQEAGVITTDNIIYGSSSELLEAISDLID